jgi:hypothetical protein
LPSAQPLPTITDLLTAGHRAVTGQRDRYGDVHSGAIYDHIAGPTAILFAREADRDRDGFRSIYFDDADGDILTNLVQQRYGIARILDTFGQGKAYIRRATAAAGGGIIYRGTRLLLGGLPPFEFSVSADTLVSGTTADLPIQSTTIGSGTGVRAFSGGMSFEDPIFDASWTITGIDCQPGTDFEPADEFRARVRQLRIQQRNGYVPEMVTVCQAQGATYVFAFPSQYGLAATDFVDDYGINALYVADANFQSSSALVLACMIALESVRVLGADLWIGGVVHTPVSVVATVTLVDDPGKLDQVSIQRSLTQALLAYFAPTQAGYLYKRTAMAGAMKAAHPAVQTVTFTSPSSDPTIGPSAWPATLARYTLVSNSIQLTLAPPI